MKNVVKAVHKKLVFGKRIRVLAEMISEMIPDNTSILDVGCGDGSIPYLIKQNKPSLKITGLEIMRRETTLIDCDIFDGNTIPKPDTSYDVTMMVDVLHHTPDVKALLGEATRVSRKYVIIKDHLCENKENFMTLKFMDWIGNRPDGVRLVYNYKSRKQWEAYFSDAGLRVVRWEGQPKIHGFPLNLFFGRRLHFIALLEKTAS